MPTKAYAASSAAAPLAPFSLDRRAQGATDVAIEILYCGVCHSDLHTVRNEWKGTTYPCVPGHEIVGRVTAVGAHVAGFQPGDLAAVGCMVDACRDCEQCRAGFEQFCDAAPTFTYNSPDRHLGGMTYGGYSAGVVVDQAFVLRVPTNLDPAAAAPLLCAGITTYSPLRRAGRTRHESRRYRPGGPRPHGREVRPRVRRTDGVVHHVARQGRRRETFGRRRSGGQPRRPGDGRARRHVRRAARYGLGRSRHQRVFEFTEDGRHADVGRRAEKPLPVAAFSLIPKRRTLNGSMIGGIAETQEMLDFCGAHGIVSDIETIRIQDIEAAYARMLKGDVKYRFVIDMASLSE
ncbi:MAG: alcohol dehydrogenase catalytic domain-containing protein [Pirellulales bacterium]